MNPLANGSTLLCSIAQYSKQSLATLLQVVCKQSRVCLFAFIIANRFSACAFSSRLPEPPQEMLSRLAPSGSGTARLVAVVPVRSASNLPATTQSGAVEPEHQNEQEPNFFQKIALRFQGTGNRRWAHYCIALFPGIPLPGESQKPKSAFDQMHAFAVPKPLPEMPKDYKEYPERDLVRNDVSKNSIMLPWTALSLHRVVWSRSITSAQHSRPSSLRTLPFPWTAQLTVDDFIFHRSPSAYHVTLNSSKIHFHGTT